MILIAFRSRVRTELIEEILAMDEEMKTLARAMPGFVEYKEFVAEDGEALTLVLFQDEASLAAWRDHPRHREAMMLGYDRWMSAYDISVCEVARHYTREDRREGMERGRMPGVVLTG